MKVTLSKKVQPLKRKKLELKFQADLQGNDKKIANFRCSLLRVGHMLGYVCEAKKGSTTTVCKGMHAAMSNHQCKRKHDPYNGIPHARVEQVCNARREAKKRRLGKQLGESWKRSKNSSSHRKSGVGCNNKRDPNKRCPKLKRLCSKPHIARRICAKTCCGNRQPDKSSYKRKGSKKNQRMIPGRSRRTVTPKSNHASANVPASKPAKTVVVSGATVEWNAFYNITKYTMSTEVRSHILDRPIVKEVYCEGNRCEVAKITVCRKKKCGEKENVKMRALAIHF